MDSKRCPMRTKLGSPAGQGKKRQQTKTQVQPETGSGGWGKKLHAQRPPGLAQRCVCDTTQHLQKDAADDDAEKVEGAAPDVRSMDGEAVVPEAAVPDAAPADEEAAEPKAGLLVAALDAM